MTSGIASASLASMCWLLCACASSAITEPEPPALHPEVFSYEAEAVPWSIGPALPAPDGILLNAIHFESPRGGVVTGELALPADRGASHPAIIVLHGMPQTPAAMRAEVLQLARRGALVVSIAAPFARRDGTPLSFTPQDSVEQVQLIVDLRYTVDLLVARTDVDAARIGFMGFSYGAAMGALLAGVETRISTYVLMSGDGGLVAHFTGPDDDGGTLSRMGSAQRDRWLAAMRPIEPLYWVHRAPPASILFQSGRYDDLVPGADSEAIHRAARHPKVIRWYDAGHSLNSLALSDRLQWFSSTLGTAAP